MLEPCPDVWLECVPACRSGEDLFDQQGDLLRYLAENHDTLRVQQADSNRSRWPLHPLWRDLQERIRQFDCIGIWRDGGFI